MRNYEKESKDEVIEEIENIEIVIENIREDIEILHKNDRNIFLMLIGMFAVLLILGIAMMATG